MPFEIISLHIHKCAGRSFREILKQYYANNMATRNMNKYDFVNTSLEEIFPTVDLIHGHFYFSLIEPIYKKYNSKLIVWLRNPVDRVISHYYFIMNKVFEGDEKAIKKNLSTDCNLLDFARMPDNINLISRFISPLSYDDFFFVGFVENFETDIKRLGALLTWDMSIQPVKVNVGQKEKYNFATNFRKISDEMKNEIKRINHIDWEIYTSFQAMNALNTIK